MGLFIDADACPVTDLAIEIAKSRGVEVVLVCDSSHEMRREGARTITVLKGADSADFALVNLLQKGDVVVTQDYGLAAMCLAKGARALNQSGLVYTAENMDGLLWQRHEARKQRMAGRHLRGPKKRTREEDEAFRRALERALALTADGDML